MTLVEKVSNALDPSALRASVNSLSSTTNNNNTIHTLNNNTHTHTIPASVTSQHQQQGQQSDSLHSVESVDSGLGPASASRSIDQIPLKMNTFTELMDLHQVNARNENGDNNNLPHNLSTSSLTSIESFTSSVGPEEIFHDESENQNERVRAINEAQNKINENSGDSYTHPFFINPNINNMNNLGMMRTSIRAKGQGLGGSSNQCCPSNISKTLNQSTHSNNRKFKNQTKSQIERDQAEGQGEANQRIYQDEDEDDEKEERAFRDEEEPGEYDDEEENQNEMKTREKQVERGQDEKEKEFEGLTGQARAQSQSQLLSQANGEKGTATASPSGSGSSSQVERIASINIRNKNKSNVSNIVTLTPVENVKRNLSVDPCNLHVDNLNLNITGEDLRNFFIQFGPIQRSRVVYDSKTRLSAGYGFVMYYNPNDAKVALESTNNILFEGNYLKVTYKKMRASLSVSALSTNNKNNVNNNTPPNESSPNTNVYIAGLPLSWTDEDLIKHFHSFGPVIDSKILTDRISHRSRGVGFIKFIHLQSCYDLIKEMSGKKIKDTKNRHSNKTFTLSIRFALDKIKNFDESQEDSIQSDFVRENNNENTSNIIKANSDSISLDSVASQLSQDLTLSSTATIPSLDPSKITNNYSEAGVFIEAHNTPQHSSPLSTSPLHSTPPSTFIQPPPQGLLPFNSLSLASEVGVSPSLNNNESSLINNSDSSNRNSPSMKTLPPNNLIHNMNLNPNPNVYSPNQVSMPVPLQVPVCLSPNMMIPSAPMSLPVSIQNNPHHHTIMTPNGLMYAQSPFIQPMPIMTYPSSPTTRTPPSGPPSGNDNEMVAGRVQSPAYQNLNFIHQNQLINSSINNANNFPISQQIPIPLPSPSPLVNDSACTLFVYHLPSSVTDSDLFSLFSMYAHVVSVSVVRNNETGLSRGFAFVNMASHIDAQFAIQCLNGFPLGNKYLSVSYKSDRRNHSQQHNFQ